MELIGGRDIEFWRKIAFVWRLITDVRGIMVSLDGESFILVLVGRTYLGDYITLYSTEYDSLSRGW